jgi:hypothetical protein
VVLSIVLGLLLTWFPILVIMHRKEATGMELAALLDKKRYLERLE